MPHDISYIRNFDSAEIETMFHGEYSVSADKKLFNMTSGSGYYNSATHFHSAQTVGIHDDSQTWISALPYDRFETVNWKTDSNSATQILDNLVPNNVIHFEVDASAVNDYNVNKMAYVSINGTVNSTTHFKSDGSEFSYKLDLSKLLIGAVIARQATFNNGAYSRAFSALIVGALERVHDVAVITVTVKCGIAQWPDQPSDGLTYDVGCRISVGGGLVSFLYPSLPPARVNDSSHHPDESFEII